MSQSVVVTLNAGSISEDFQLPSDLPIRDLSGILMNGLKNISPAEFKDKKYLLLLHNRQGLVNFSNTISDYGIRDGDILDVIFAEADNE